MEEETVHKALFTAQWNRLVGNPRHRRKILTSSDIRCDFSDWIDLDQGVVNPD
jgi:hypothetical protein